MRRDSGRGLRACPLRGVGLCPPANRLAALRRLAVRADQHVVFHALPWRGADPVLGRAVFSRPARGYVLLVAAAWDMVGPAVDRPLVLRTSALDVFGCLGRLSIRADLPRGLAAELGRREGGAGRHVTCGLGRSKLGISGGCAPRVGQLVQDFARRRALPRRGATLVRMADDELPILSCTASAIPPAVDH